jgi:hypothetical protein
MPRPTLQHSIPASVQASLPPILPPLLQPLKFPPTFPTADEVESMKAPSDLSQPSVSERPNGIQLQESLLPAESLFFYDID